MKKIKIDLGDLKDLLLNWLKERIDRPDVAMLFIADLALWMAYNSPDPRFTVKMLGDWIKEQMQIYNEELDHHAKDD